MTQRTVLFLHAHPDDETLSFAGAICLSLAAGHRVVVVTATRGERGELMGEALGAIEGDPEATAVYREGEISRAMTALGVVEHRFLGVDGARYRDSGMRWGDDGHAVPERSDEPGTLTGEPLERVAADIATLLRELAPDAVVIPNGFGGYGHPDHVRVHDATLAAVAGLESPPAVFAAERPARIAAQRAERIAADGTFTPVVNDRLNTIPDSLVQAAVDARPFHEAILAALRSYPSQVVVREVRDAAGVERVFAGMSNGEADEVGDFEYYREVTGNWRYLGAGRVAPGLVDGWRRVHGDVPRVPARTQVARALWMVPLGLALGAATTLMHQYLWYPTGSADLSLPVGIVLGLIAVALGVASARYLGQTRAQAVGLSLGVLVAVGVLAQRSPGGSVVVPDNALGNVWIYGTLLVALIVLMLPVPSLREGGQRETMNVANVEGTIK